MPLILQNCSSNRDKWLELKQKTIGSSEIATICGLNQYRTPLELWAEKTGKIPGFEGNDATYLGQLMEMPIAMMFARKTDKKIERADHLYVHTQHEWASATPDYWVHEEDGTDAILECKNTGYRKAADWDDKSPFWAQVQVQWQLGVIGMESAYIAVLIGGNSYGYKHEPITFSKDVFDQAINLGGQFMDYVRKDIPPSAGPNDKAVLNELIKSREDKVIKLPSQTVSIISEYLAIRQERLKMEKAVKAQKDIEAGYENRLLQYMENATDAVVDKYKLKATVVIKAPYETKESRYTLFSAKEVKE